MVAACTLDSLGPPLLRSGPLWLSIFQGLPHLAVQRLGAEMN